MKFIGGLQKTFFKDNTISINLKRYQRVAIGAISGSKLFTYPVYFKDDNNNEFKEIVISQFPPKYWHNTFRIKFWIKDDPGITNLIFSFLAKNYINVYTQESIMTRFDDYFTISVVADMTYFINKVNNKIFISDKHINQLFDFILKKNNNENLFNSIKSKIYLNIKDDIEKDEFDKILDEVLINQQQKNLLRLEKFIDVIRKRLITNDDYDKFDNLDYKISKLQEFLVHLFSKDKKINNLKYKDPTVKKLNFLNKHSGRYTDSDDINQLPDDILSDYRVQDVYESLVVDCGNLHLDKDIIKQIGLSTNKPLYYTINSDTDEKYILVRFFENANIVQLDIEHKAGRYGALSHITEKIASYNYNIISSYDRVQNADTLESIATSHWIVMLDCTNYENKLPSLILDIENTEKVVNIGIRTINSSFKESFNGVLDKYIIDMTNELHCETKEVKDMHKCYHTVIKSLISEIKIFYIFTILLFIIVLISVIKQFSNISSKNSLITNIVLGVFILLLIIFPIIMKSIGYNKFTNAFMIIFNKNKFNKNIKKRFEKLKDSNGCE